MIPINSHCDIFYIFSSTCLNYDSRFVLLIYMSQLCLGATELCFTYSHRESHWLRFHLLITILTNDFQGFWSTARNIWSVTHGLLQNDLEWYTWHKRLFSTSRWPEISTIVANPIVPEAGNIVFQCAREGESWIWVSTRPLSTFQLITHWH